MDRAQESQDFIVELMAGVAKGCRTVNFAAMSVLMLAGHKHETLDVVFENAPSEAVLTKCLHLPWPITRGANVPDAGR